MIKFLKISNEICKTKENQKCVSHKNKMDKTFVKKTS